MKKIVIASFIALLITGLLAGGYFYYQQVKVPRSDVWNAVSSDAAFVIEGKNIKQAWMRLSESMIWKEFSDMDYFQKINSNMSFFDSVVSKKKELQNLIENQSLLISFHLTKADDFDCLYMLNVPSSTFGKQEDFAGEMVNSIAGNSAAVSKRMYENTLIREVQLKDKEKTFTYTVSKGLFIGSFTAFLVEDAIRQMKSGKPVMQNETFAKVYESAGKKVDASIYFNYKHFFKLLSIFLSPENKDLFDTPGNLASWAGVDLKIKPAAIAMNGFTSLSKSEQQEIQNQGGNTESGFFSTLLKQNPQPMDLLKILPKRTAVLLYFAMNDFKEYYQNYKSCLSKENLTLAEQLSQKYHLSLEESMLSWVDNEYAVIVTEPSSSNYTNNSFAVFHAKDISLAKKLLKRFGELAMKEEHDERNGAEETYKGHAIGYIGTSVPVLHVLLGTAFSKMEKLFYTSINDYIIFGNQASAIRSFIDDFETQKLLSKDASYLTLTDNLSSKTNFYLYINLSRSLQIAKGYVSENTAHLLDNYAGHLKKLDALAFQLTSGTQGISKDGTKQPAATAYSTLYLQYNTVKKSDANLLWAAQLDTSVSSSPQIVFNPKTGTNEIIVQDDANVLYLLDDAGQILWKDTLPEKIIGKIEQIDYYKNDKRQFLFNTASRIYLIDRKGEKVGNYPIKLPAPATNGAVVFDYDRKKDYRIFVACANRVVYAYQGNGKPVEGWSFNKPVGTVKNPIQYFTLLEKDYLVVNDDKGGVYILDRKGKARVEILEKINTEFIHPFVLEKGKTVAESRLVTTDTLGKIYSIYFNGEVKIQRFKEWSPLHFFDFQDINADMNKDYIFLDNNRLFVYNKDSSLIFSYEFEQEITQRPLCFPFSNGKGKIGIVSDKTNELFLFNDDGTLYNGFPLKGSTAFVIDNLVSETVSSFTGKSHQNIVVTGSSDRNVYMYSLE